MNDAERRKLEELLRAALHHEAARIQPAADGLTRIRQRLATRQRARLWLRPGLAVLATVSAVVVAVTVVPVYLQRHDSTGRLTEQMTLSAPPAMPVTPTTTTDTTAPRPSASTDTGTPSGRVTRSAPPTAGNGDQELADMTTVWPYSTRREATQKADLDVRRHVHPDLVDPRATAVQFIQSFVGTSDRLVPDEGVRLAAGIGVTVSRQTDEGLHPVSLVYLVRVRKADDSPYVVVNASGPVAEGRPAMSVDPGRLNGTSELSVHGSFFGPPDVIASVKVQLREPGSDEVLASDSPPFFADPQMPDQHDWKARLTPIRKLRTSTGTVAAWTVDVENHLLTFVAEPTDAD